MKNSLTCSVDEEVGKLTAIAFCSMNNMRDRCFSFLRITIGLRKLDVTLFVSHRFTRGDYGGIIDFGFILYGRHSSS